MIPSEYRLETVVARLAERLDGARRSFDDEAALEAAFARITDEQLTAAIAEWRALGWNDDPEAHARFLRTEVTGTFLPRYQRAAMAMNRTEADGYGLGAAASPLGRVGLTAVALLVLWFALLRFAELPVVWPLILLDLALPFLPDVARTLAVRRYRGALEEAIDDMARIQEQALAYAPGRSEGAAGPSAAATADPPRPPRLRQGQ